MVTITYKVKIQDEFVEDYFTSVGQGLTGLEAIELLYLQNGSMELTDIDYPGITEEEKEEILRTLNENVNNAFTDEQPEITVVK